MWQRRSAAGVSDYGVPTPPQSVPRELLQEALRLDAEERHANQSGCNPIQLTNNATQNAFAPNNFQTMHKQSITGTNDIKPWHQFPAGVPSIGSRSIRHIRPLLSNYPSKNTVSPEIQFNYEPQPLYSIDRQSSDSQSNHIETHLAHSPEQYNHPSHYQDTNHYCRDASSFEDTHQLHIKPTQLMESSSESLSFPNRSYESLDHSIHPSCNNTSEEMASYTNKQLVNSKPHNDEYSSANEFSTNNLNIWRHHDPHKESLQKKNQSSFQQIPSGKRLAFYSNNLMKESDNKPSIHSAVNKHISSQKVVNQYGMIPSYAVIIGPPLIALDEVLRFVLSSNSFNDPNATLNGMGPIGLISKDQLMSQAKVAHHPMAHRIFESEQQCSPIDVAVSRVLLDSFIRGSKYSMLVIEGLPSDEAEYRMLLDLLGVPQLVILLTISSKDAMQQLNVLREAQLLELPYISQKMFDFDHNIPIILNLFQHITTTKVIDAGKVPVLSLASTIRTELTKCIIPAGGSLKPNHLNENYRNRDSLFDL